jgi:thiamine biosynthesis lipoprotein
MPVQVRDSASPARSFHLFDLHDAAAATSADSFRDGRDVLVEPRSQRLKSFAGSITVVAPTCAMADALTKIVALRPAEAVAIMARHGAHAFRIGHDGDQVVTTWTGADANSSGHLRLPLAMAA